MKRGVRRQDVVQRTPMPGAFPSERDELGVDPAIAENPEILEPPGEGVEIGWDSNESS